MTRVDLQWNKLTVFEEGVFKEMLQQMESVHSLVGYVDVSASRLFNTFVSNIMKYFIGLF